MINLSKDIAEVEKFERIAAWLEMDINMTPDRSRYVSEQTQGALKMFEHFHCGDVKKIQKQLEKEWSDIMDMLHPHQKDDESIYCTAVRMFASE